MKNSLLNYSYLIKKSWPIILANAAAPILGLVDTAVIGNYGTVEELAAIAFGALIFNFLYWSFGFLRMATTGYIAQADGAKDEDELRAVITRSALLAFFIGIILVTFQKPIANICFALLSENSDVGIFLKDYYDIRIWGAPAALFSFAVNGFLIGLGASFPLLKLQLILNGTNIFLDLLFAGYMGMGVKGIALGTLIAEILTFITGAYITWTILYQRKKELNWPWKKIKDGKMFLKTIKEKSYILVRTLLLMIAFTLFINQSSSFGNTILAANHILLQFISFSAFFLDAYAFVVESLVGKAIGAKDSNALKEAISKSTWLAGVTALILAISLSLLGPYLIAALTGLENVRIQALQSLTLSAIYIFLAFPAFQLDGIFIGASLTKEMCYASLISFIIFLAALWLILPQWGIGGLWTAFILFVCARALSLLLFQKRIWEKIS